jgi:putative FmdB family regulatory protein
MPVYEFYCPYCHRIFNFLSRRINTNKQPDCPRCGRQQLRRRVSMFAISKGRKEEDAADMPDIDEGRMEQAMQALMSEAEGLNEDDPRQAARLMRKLYETTGMEIGGSMEEAIRRMEAGEDPEQIEAEPAPWRPAWCHGARPAVVERGAGATRRRRGGKKSLYFSYPFGI